MKAPKAIFVSYCPKDIYEGTELMPALDELAYRRLIDLIYMTGDRVPDDGEALARSTKAAERWPDIRQRLIDSGKVRVVHGRLTNERCQKELAKVGAKIDKNRRAGVASAESRKALKERDNPTDVPTNVPTSGQPNHLTTESLNHSSEEGKERTLFGLEDSDQNVIPLVDPNKLVWDMGKTLLIGAGEDPRKAASMIGKWLKEAGRGPLLEALTAAIDLQTGDPVAWITKALQARAGGQRPGRRVGLTVEEMDEKRQAMGLAMTAKYAPHMLKEAGRG